MAPGLATPTGYAKYDPPQDATLFEALMRAGRLTQRIDRGYGDVQVRFLAGASQASEVSRAGLHQSPLRQTAGVDVWALVRHHRGTPLVRRLARDPSSG